MNGSRLFVLLPQSAAAVQGSGRDGTNKPPTQIPFCTLVAAVTMVHVCVLGLRQLGQTRCLDCNPQSTGLAFTTWLKTALMFPVPHCSPVSLPVFSSYFDLITPNEFVYPYCPPEPWRVVSCQREGVREGAVLSVSHQSPRFWLMSVSTAFPLFVRSAVGLYCSAPALCLFHYLVALSGVWWKLRRTGDGAN